MQLSFRPSCSWLLLRSSVPGKTLQNYQPSISPFQAHHHSFAHTHALLSLPFPVSNGAPLSPAFAASFTFQFALHLSFYSGPRLLLRAAGTLAALTPRNQLSWCKRFHTFLTSLSFGEMCSTGLRVHFTPDLLNAALLLFCLIKPTVL